MYIFNILSTVSTTNIHSSRTSIPSKVTKSTCYWFLFNLFNFHYSFSSLYIFNNSLYLSPIAYPEPHQGHLTTSLPHSEASICPIGDNAPTGYQPYPMHLRQLFSLVVSMNIYKNIRFINVLFPLDTKEKKSPLKRNNYSNVNSCAIFAVAIMFCFNTVFIN